MGSKREKFTEEWKKLYREYKAAGMSEEDIQDIYAVRPECVQENRTECQRTQPLSEAPVTTEPNRVNLCLPY